MHDSKHRRPTVIEARPTPSLFSLPAEQCVIGGLLLKQDAWPDVSRLLSPADFHDERHALLFRAMRELADAGTPIDPVTVFDWLDRAGQTLEAGGYEGILTLATDTPNPSMASVYARIVRRKALERRRATAIERGDHERAADLTAQIKALDAGPTATPRLLTIKEVMARAADYDWLITGLIERQQSGVLWGDTGTLKTLQAIDMACRIATGTPWNGCETQQGGVLYIVGEGAGRGITRRFKAWQIKNGISIEDAPILIREVPTTLPTDTAALIADAKALLAATGWTLELVILDTLSRTMDGDENSQSDFGAYQRALDQVRAEFGCATLFLHHSGHADKDRPRGASSITCNADVSLAMHAAPGDTVKLSAPKLKDAGKPADLFFRLVVVELGETGKDGQPITSVTLMPVAPPVEATKATKAVLRPYERQALSILEKNGPLLIGDWRALFRDAWMKENPDTKGSTFRMMWGRIKDSLQTANAITVQGDTVSAVSPLAEQSVTPVTPVTPVTNASHVTPVTPPTSQQSVTSVTPPFKGCDAVTPVVTGVTGVAPPGGALSGNDPSIAPDLTATEEKTADPAADLPFRSSLLVAPLEDTPRPPARAGELSGNDPPAAPALNPSPLEGYLDALLADAADDLPSRSSLNTLAAADAPRAPPAAVTAVAAAHRATMPGVARLMDQARAVFGDGVKVMYAAEHGFEMDKWPAD